MTAAANAVLLFCPGDFASDGDPLLFPREAGVGCEVPPVT